LRVLGIETSCDETAVALVEDGRKVLANLVASQVDVHSRYGGVVPELASRRHVELLTPLLEHTLDEAGMRFADVEGIAVTVGPGLVGSLLVGLAAAKAVALATKAPFVGVNHLEGHVYANFLEYGEPGFPFVSFIVSGGHTMLVHVPEPHRYEILGQTIDDAAGEAFDKIARFLGLGYPGGPEIDRVAAKGDPEAVRFPRALEGQGYDFSLSGLKTAVIRHVRRERAEGRDVKVADLAASFQEAVIDVQVDKAMAAARDKGVSQVLLGGGVVANTRLRERMLHAGRGAGIMVLFPPLELCTDNAAMIACAGFYRLARGERTSLEIGADPSLALDSTPSTDIRLA
jgi:N6-L-threonylcarbamoyladenine synthase